MAKKILAVLLVAIAGFVVYVATRPATYHVERSITIDAPAEVVFGLVGDLAAWGLWSPWEKLDPGMKRTFSATTTGVGASYAWAGNQQVGSGKMTIAESEPSRQVAFRLDFFTPFASVATSAFTLVQHANGSTRTTWSMDGHNDFAGKAMGLFMDFDAMIGADYEKGLAALGELARQRVDPPGFAPPAAAAPPAAGG